MGFDKFKVCKSKQNSNWESRRFCPTGPLIRDLENKNQKTQIETRPHQRKLTEEDLGSKKQWVKRKNLAKIFEDGQCKFSKLFTLTSYWVLFYKTISTDLVGPHKYQRTILCLFNKGRYSPVD
jgi:hypothetical protein